MLITVWRKRMEMEGEGGREGGGERERVSELFSYIE